MQYANVDGWTPDAPRPEVSARPELDRWLLSHLQSLVREVDAQMELYQLYNVVPPVLGYIDDLTNWYIRLSRRRFWRPGGGDDKAAAYATLYEVLVTFSKVLAPFLPFVAEVVYQELVVGAGTVRSDTVIRARTLEVRLAPEKGKLEVTFGECVLDVGDEPTAEASDDDDDEDEHEAHDGKAERGNGRADGLMAAIVASEPAE